MSVNKKLVCAHYILAAKSESWNENELCAMNSGLFLNITMANNNSNLIMAMKQKPNDRRPAIIQKTFIQKTKERKRTRKKSHFVANKVITIKI